MNPFKSEVTFSAGGRDLTLKMSINSLILLQQQMSTGKGPASLEDIYTAAANG
jgi:hypothetical protein